MNKLYYSILTDIIQDVRQERKLNPEEPMLEIQEVSHEAITVFDMLWSENDPDGRFYTIANPDSLSEKVLMNKLIVPHSASNSAYKVDSEALIHWLYESLPKEMWMTLNKIILVYDDEADFEELYNRNDIGELLGLHDLTKDGCCGLTWATEDIVVVDVQHIVRFSLDDADKDGLPWYVDEDINRGIKTTLIHEIRHVAQNNPYLPETILQQESSDEDDAEEYARNFVDKHPCYVLCE